ncbi:SusD/RagB family nutrient-binding outer membrane lipoprotein [Fulvivirgaceae bacterium BMA12]|uniref:SusD/RagB family nutrient-binding outer membrane lipoprotein n=1 Tax=Agaribacillus aureus TaxID=3051825 RepID=A0ABT8LBI1_9BACT|nr:SusD/RagB family nutrient-binding outer membrane lipoprotein [Fulvivirgaceae bacterium BMA12]
MKQFKTMLLCILIFAGCTDDFEDINTNNNEPETVSPNLLLSTVLSKTLTDQVNTGWSNGNIVAQLTAKINFTDFDRYNWGSESGKWNDYYGNLTEVELILESARAEESKNPSYEAMALIVKSWIYSNLTDSWGEVPYSEAIKGQTDGEFQPKYDSQESIYNGILADLTAADGLLTQGVPIFGGDLLYDGDLLAWRKLANSLQLRYLMRISSKVDVSSQMQQIIDNKPIFESNEDNAVLIYPAASVATSFPIGRGRIGGFDEHRLSETSEAVLKGFGDNRLNTWFQPTDNPNDDPTLFVGLPNGLSENNASTFNGGASNVSRLNQGLFFDSPDAVGGALMQHAELQFILAEAAQRGMITGDGQTYYEEGVKSSFEYWNTEQDLTAYLSQPGVAYNGELDVIMRQKWLASFMVGLEAWYDFRRTGLPEEIQPGQDNVNDNQVPVRFLYPDQEQSLNAENYQQAIQGLGSDNINAKGWWEN